MAGLSIRGNPAETEVVLVFIVEGFFQEVREFVGTDRLHIDLIDHVKIVAENFQFCPGKHLMI